MFEQFSIQFEFENYDIFVDDNTFLELEIRFMQEGPLILENVVEIVDIHRDLNSHIITYSSRVFKRDTDIIVL